MEKAIAGDKVGLEELLDRAATEADAEGARPRVTAMARDERGNTLLALAAWHNKMDVSGRGICGWVEGAR